MRCSRYRRLMTWHCVLTIFFYKSHKIVFFLFSITLGNGKSHKEIWTNCNKLFLCLQIIWTSSIRVPPTHGPYYKVPGNLWRFSKPETHRRIHSVAHGFTNFWTTYLIKIVLQNNWKILQVDLKENFTFEYCQIWISVINHRVNFQTSFCVIFYWCEFACFGLHVCI